MQAYIHQYALKQFNTNIVEDVHGLDKLLYGASSLPPGRRLEHKANLCTFMTQDGVCRPVS